MFRFNNRFIHKLILVITILFIGSVAAPAGPIGIEKGVVKITDLPIDRFTDKYDSYFRKYTKRNFSFSLDYRWFKSQTAAESAFIENARSPVGAEGLMQLMAPTWEEIIDEVIHIPDDILNPKWNIAAGIYYDAKMYRKWKAPRPELDRLALMFASYNAGFGNILKAQKKCFMLSDDYGGLKECNLWVPIKEQGEKVSSWKHEETVHYVTKIFKLMGYSDY